MIRSANCSPDSKREQQDVIKAKIALKNAENVLRLANWIISRLIGMCLLQAVQRGTTGPKEMASLFALIAVTLIDCIPFRKL